MEGEPDTTVAAVFNSEQRVLLTLDVGFADIRAYPPAEHEGLIVLRLKRQDKPAIMEALEKLLPVSEEETAARKLWVEEEDRVRIRELELAMNHSIKARVSYPLEMDGKFYTVENIPARVDEETGEQFFSPETVERLQETVRSSEASERIIETPAYIFPG